MKLIVSTFLVYKVKKCLLKSGKVSSSDGPSMPSGWSACARYTGIRSPPSGHRQPRRWATTAHNVGNECPNIGLIFGQYSLVSLRCLNYLFALFKLLFLVYRAVFNDTSIVFHATSMILLSAFFEKSHWL